MTSLMKTGLTGCAMFFYPELLGSDGRLLTERFFFGEEDFEFAIMFENITNYKFVYQTILCDYTELEENEDVFDFLERLLIYLTDDKELNEKLQKDRIDITLTGKSVPMGKVHPLTQTTNEIVKIFSVAAVIFMPATLVASMYGMNFKFMPELNWEYGYVWAIILMLTVSGFTFWYFKFKKWL